MTSNNKSPRKNLAVTQETYDRLVTYGKFDDKGFNGLIDRLLDEIDMHRATARKARA